MRDTHPPICPSILNYVLRVKKVEVANCEAISQSLLLEKEMKEWNAEMDDVEREEVKMTDGKLKKQVIKDLEAIDQKSFELRRSAEQIADNPFKKIKLSEKGILINDYILALLDYEEIFLKIKAKLEEEAEEKVYIEESLRKA